MNQRPTIREQMDACRPDSDDLLLPEHAADLAELQAGLRESAEFRAQWERSQQDSRTIRSAMQDVVLPAGLEARLLAAVQAAESVPTLAGVEKATRTELPAQEIAAVSTKATSLMFSRRWILAGGFVAASVLAGFVALQILPKKDEPVSKDQLAGQVQDWLRSVDVRSMKAPTTAVRLPADVLAPANGASSFTSSQGTITAYQLSRRGSTAFLLVIPTAKSYPVDALPYTKVGVSGGWQVGAWQTGGVLYVIATKANLVEFVRQPQIG